MGGIELHRPMKGKCWRLLELFCIQSDRDCFEVPSVDRCKENYFSYVLETGRDCGAKWDGGQMMG